MIAHSLNSLIVFVQNFDCHNHSVFSDGLLKPRDLIELAKKSGCDAIALTDHDNTGGLAEAGAAAEELQVRFIRGVELSVTWPGKMSKSATADINPITIHVVGLGINQFEPALVAGIASIRDGRLDRARQMGVHLAGLGMPGVFEEAWALAENKDMIGRTHFARAMVARGLAKNVGSVFGRFLTPGKPGYVAHQWASLNAAIDWINGAGGVAVLAHPGRYKLSGQEMRSLLQEFKENGGRAIEVITGSHEKHQYREFAGLAREFDFMASRGSDFHGVGESRFHPGTLPLLPSDLLPVWSVLQ
jgi:predicted metal-dependent phosphoesterase TrpH